MVTNVLQVDCSENLGDYCMDLLPFFHIYGTMTINLVIYQPKAMVVLPSFKPETLLGALSKYRLFYRDPQVMIGYDDNPEATDSSLTKNGFMKMGDIGYIDDDGFVSVVDRAKELIKYKGHGVAPAELEDVLNHYPYIMDSCCVRSQHAKGEEIPKAFVVLEHPGDLTVPTRENVITYVSEPVVPYKKVCDVEFIDSISKNASGKLLRCKLQDRETHTNDTALAA
ncbi:hypothetical protein BBJ29_007840 [Phytophthora kernoviae]|uniref:AMP-binding enzyme C-terminal domain-containing protein n=1 Tax=Phytophthora kernoviae TaxID=325452 RepID=A0A3F2RMK3_9STRA|nr:hypothetical protein BBJ29_007840 [Phytophthora kernoviae]RLN60590.1 hypothetical protein BBP00_00005886 [Phytophthora kernoviae]